MYSMSLMVEEYNCQLSLMMARHSLSFHVLWLRNLENQLRHAKTSGPLMQLEDKSDTLIFTTKCQPCFL